MLYVMLTAISGPHNGTYNGIFPLHPCALDDDIVTPPLIRNQPGEPVPELQSIVRSWFRAVEMAVMIARIAG